MFLLRVLALLAVAAIGVSCAMYLFTRDRKYLGWALRLARWSVGAALAVFALMALERLIVLV